MSEVTAIDLKAMIKAKAEKNKADQQRKVSERALIMEKKMVALMPIKTMLSNTLSELGFSVTMHTDPSHCPCPAVHVRGHHNMYEKFGEIFIDSDNVIRSGGCNTHRHKHKSEQAFYEFVADNVATVI